MRRMQSRWALLESLRARLADEQGTIISSGATRVALCYPSPYHVGMSSLGFQTVYRELNEHEDCAAERAFLPDDVAAHRAARAGVITIESQRPIGDFDAIAFSVSYELELLGLLEMLELSGLPLHAADRHDAHPLVVCGGPLTFSNPVPLAPFALRARTALLGRTARAPDLDHFRFGRFFLGLCRGRLFGRRNINRRLGFRHDGGSRRFGDLA